MIKRVKEASIAKECNKLLSLLIEDEIKYNKFVKPMAVTDYFENLINDDKNILLVKVIDDKVVGYAFFKPVVDNDVPGYLLDGIYIMEAYRGLKIGKELMDTGLNIIKDYNVKFVDVYCMNGNNACMLYQSFGFNIIKNQFRKEL